MAWRLKRQTEAGGGSISKWRYGESVMSSMAESVAAAAIFGSRRRNRSNGEIGEKVS